MHCEPPPGFADGDILEDGVKGDDEGDSSLSAVAAAHGVSAALGGAARPSLTTMWDDAIPSSTHRATPSLFTGIEEEEPDDESDGEPCGESQEPDGGNGGETEPESSHDESSKNSSDESDDNDESGDDDQLARLPHLIDDGHSSEGEKENDNTLELETPAGRPARAREAVAPPPPPKKRKLSKNPFVLDEAKGWANEESASEKVRASRPLSTRSSVPFSSPQPSPPLLTLAAFAPPHPASLSTPLPHRGRSRNPNPNPNPTLDDSLSIHWGVLVAENPLCVFEH